MGNKKEQFKTLRNMPHSSLQIWMDSKIKSGLELKLMAQRWHTTRVALLHHLKGVTCLGVLPMASIAADTKLSMEQLTSEFATARLMRQKHALPPGELLPEEMDPTPRVQVDVLPAYTNYYHADDFMDGRLWLRTTATINPALENYVSIGTGLRISSKHKLVLGLRPLRPFPEWCMQVPEIRTDPNASPRELRLDARHGTGAPSLPKGSRIAMLVIAPIEEFKLIVGGLKLETEDDTP